MRSDAASFYIFQPYLLPLSIYYYSKPIISQISSYDEFALCRDGKEREKDHGGCGWEPREHVCTLLLHHQSHLPNQQASFALCQATFCFLLLGCRRFVIFTFLIIISAFCTNLYNSNYLFYQGLIILGDVYGKGYNFILNFMGYTLFILLR